MTEQCEHHIRGIRCTAAATTHLIGEHAEHDDVSWICAECKDSFLTGWERMQADAAALRSRGVPKQLLSRIMCLRVDRGDYECCPAPGRSGK